MRQTPSWIKKGLPRSLLNKGFSQNMTTFHHALSLLVSIPLVSMAIAEVPRDDRCFELRIYTAAEGKLDALHARFRDHTMKLFEKHGMTNIGYFTPLDESEQKLFYVLAYPNRESRKESWSSFMVDPEWLTVMSTSEKNGKLLTNIESTFLHLTDYSPQLKASANGGPRIFELRRYTSTAGNLTRLHDRFRDHTMNLFARHGMTNVVYWALDADQPAANDTLVYLLAHQSKSARDANFEAFRQDSTWITAKEASEKAAGGSLTMPDGVKSLLLTPTDYSALK